ncbi:MAG: DUF4334 domain-containing protein [Propionibacteriaceae bacterium]|jgi:hypothetical protein|nr:DUF4334 domain-containing protein [Propionibacteriaceae bacterium]
MDFLHGGQGSQAEAWALFDSLEPVAVERLTGLWRGRELRAGCALEGLLTSCRWYGKRFIDPEHVQPTIFARPDGSLFAVNPSLLPMWPSLNRVPAGLMGRAFDLARPGLITRGYHARLRALECRGRVSAAMVYDRLPVIDSFRRIDPDRLLGVMDLKGSPDSNLLFFTLERPPAQKEENQA